MNDRELLEVAARAAGYKPHGWDDDINRLRVEGEDGPGLPWNPLMDDGDALRLAVKLKMDVTIGQSVKVVCATNDCGASRVVLPLGDDPYAERRRAIVEAAAEIVKEIGAPQGAG